MKILVTGSAGFIGFHTALKILLNGDEVVGLDCINDYYDRSLKYDRLKELGISENEISYGKLVQSDKYVNHKFVQIKLEDNESLMALFESEKFDLVCNLAAQAGVRYSIENPSAYIDSNIVGFANLLECCRKNEVAHLVYASSSSVYGKNSKVPFSEDDRVDSPVSLYAATKKANELMAYAYENLYGFRTTGLRFFTVYGPWGRPDMAPMLFAKAIASNQPIKVFNNGNMVRDFTYIDDIVEGVMSVIYSRADTATENKVYNIGCSSPVNLLDFITTMEDTFGKKANLVMTPMQKGDVFQTYADVSKLARDYGYKPKIMIKEGVAKFAEWYKNYYRSIYEW